MTSAVADEASLSTALAGGAAALGVHLSAHAVRQLLAYVALLAKWNRVYNLTAIREPARMVTHHLLDSLAVLPALERLSLPGERLRVLDVGSGAGLPGIPVAIARPGWHVAMCEANHKKGAFLTQAAAELGLPNVEVALCRVEDFRPAVPFDVVISRAFADLDAFVRAALPHVSRKGLVVAMKGAFPAAEVAAVSRDIRVIATPALDVPGLGAERHLVVMQAKEPA